MAYALIWYIQSSLTILAPLHPTYTCLHAMDGSVHVREEGGIRNELFLCAAMVFPLGFRDPVADFLFIFACSPHTGSGPKFAEEIRVEMG